MTAPTILFDLDGTLLSTAPDLLASLNFVLESEGLRTLTENEVGHQFGQGARAMIMHGYRHNAAMADENRLAAMTERFVRHYADNMPGQSALFPGLAEAMDRLDGAGMTLAVCTNKREDLARTLLEGLSLTHRFAAICGGDTFPVRKPDGKHLLMTIERAGGDPARAVMIGDSSSDILGAKDANIASIAVPFGYTDQPVESFGPDRVIANYAELTPELIEGLLAR
ncbi:phosphoglycolate phosphatase [Pseudohoeflea suaedae]|uniref:Phosphoglycolate phosphatase n=1 Tax=Pseudohoeflea suaedae TaxID=877384 RepID=A0A4R5PJZ3_9HYPH|nr:HAD family hydrolase [Pseudohoeflea suaedae]TDH36013.1 phosphoglycolate phosphatase [Pseudohoeflea suaedae]